MKKELPSFLYAFIVNEKVLRTHKITSRTIYHNCIHTNGIENGNKVKPEKWTQKKSSTLPFAHKLHPVVSLDDVFLVFLSICCLFLRSCAFSKQCQASFYLVKTRNINTCIVFVSAIERSLHLFITQNRFKNNVNTFLLSPFFLPHTSYSPLPSTAFDDVLYIYTEEIDPENIWYHSIVFPSCCAPLLCLSMYLFSYLLMLYWVVAFNRATKLEMLELENKKGINK